MTEPAIFYNEVNERQATFSRRAVVMGGVVSLGLTALGARLAQLQILENNRYTTLSASNQYNFRLIPPPRGRILDRNGVAIASNRPNFRLLLLKDATNDPQSVLQAASELIPITPDRHRDILREIHEGPRFVPVAIADDLSWDEFARINVRNPELPGLQADMNEVRVYPFGGAFAHVIGYVSRVTATELAAAGPNPDPLLLNPGFRIGKQGVEKSLDLQLRGRAGGHKVEVDSKGRVVKADPAGDIRPTPGDEVVLNLDADIQNRALEVFGEESGAAVMMDCRTGEVLCLMSAPSFDANQFVKGVPAQEYEALSNYERKPLFNKALTANYPPGSTFKTMVALTALEQGVPPTRQYTCNGAWAWGGRVWHCDQAHGTLDLKGGIAHSCDIYFYQMALALGPDPIAAVARKFGLGGTFDIDIPGQKPGIIPDTVYKAKYFPKDPVWHPGETPSMGIGQGYVSVNALQLCVMCSRIANGQKALQPQLIRSIGGAPQAASTPVGDIGVDPAHLAFIREAMAEVVISGTAAAVPKLDLGPITWAGKTGTAQAHSYNGGRGAHGAAGAWADRDHSWFIAFAPADDPHFAMSALVEHGGFGAEAAAPRAREIMRVALLKDQSLRSRIENPLPDAPPRPSTPAPSAASSSPPSAAAPPPPSASSAAPTSDAPTP